MTTRIRNTAGKDSAYTLALSTKNSPQHGHVYAVKNEKTGRTWLVSGHNTELIGNYDTTPPAYVIARVSQEWARDQLRDTLKPGDTVYTTLNHVSSSGMFRRIGVRAIVNNEPQYLDGLVMLALGIKRGDKEGVPMGGCGMDMGFALVYDLSQALYGEGFKCTGKNCPSNDHSNPPYPDRYAPGPAMHHNSGDYALKHRWL